MEWDDIKHFLAVARSGSLTDAARELKSSAATVGRRVAELESKLGARLFDRSQAGYSLTECGEAIRLKAEDIEEAVLAIEREAGGRDRRATGRCVSLPRKIWRLTLSRRGCPIFGATAPAFRWKS